MPIVVAGIIGAGAAFGGAAIAAKASNKAGESAANATNHAADVQAQGAQASLDYQKQQAAQTQANFEATQRANYGQYAARQGDINNLGALIGAPARNIPDYVPTTNVSGSPSGAPPAGSLASAGQPAQTGGGPSAFLKNLLDSGVDPQQAADQTNQKFNLQTGSQAKYYAPSADTSGKAVIGLPDSYISQEPSGWSVTMRSKSAAPASKAPVAAYGSIASANVLPFQQAPALTLRGY